MKREFISLHAFSCMLFNKYIFYKFILPDELPVGYLFTLDKKVLNKDVFNHVVAIVTRQIDIIVTGAINPDIPKVHIVPDKNVIVFKIDIFFDGYMIKSK